MWRSRPFSVWQPSCTTQCPQNVVHQIPKVSKGSKNDQTNWWRKIHRFLLNTKSSNLWLCRRWWLLWDYAGGIWLCRFLVSSRHLLLASAGSILLTLVGICSGRGQLLSLVFTLILCNWGFVHTVGLSCMWCLLCLRLCVYSPTRCLSYQQFILEF